MTAGERRAGHREVTVFLADDSLIVREGVGALLPMDVDLRMVGRAADYDGLVAGAEQANPQVLVTDIRMPPNFQRKGIDAAEQLRKRHPGNGIVVLSQYHDPEYAISLLGEGAAGYAYLLKDRVAEGNHLATSIRAVAGGSSMLDPDIVQALVSPVTTTGVKLGGAKARVVIDLRERDGMLFFEVADDGAGFDLATVGRGHGLATMADRLAALGGGVDVWLETGHGTRGSGRVPLARAPGTSTPAQPAMA